jgi:hypothetical protein
MQQLLGANNAYVHQGELRTARNDSASLLPWLTEQNDKTERKETWSMLMEIAIVVLVAAELASSVANLLGRPTTAASEMHCEVTTQ